MSSPVVAVIQSSHPGDPPPSSLGEIGGRSVVLAYSGVAAEYQAIRTGTAIVDRSHRHRMRFTGPKAGEVLTGLVTNDVLALEPGQGQYAVALTAKGRIVADLRIFAQEDSYLVDAPVRAADGWSALVRKFVNPRLAPFKDESDEIRSVAIVGEQSRHVVTEITGVHATALAVLPPYSHVRISIDGGLPAAVVAHIPDLQVDGYELFVPADLFSRVWERAVEAGAVPAGLDAWEVARVEAGRPEFGIDVDDSTLPQEANLDELHAISYTKGCYTGQEVVARVHFRGHVNRHLRALRTADAQPPSSKAILYDAEGTAVGDVRSAVSSPRLGGIAIGMVRREVKAGSQLVARTDAGEWRVDVAPLPFPPNA